MAIEGKKITVRAFKRHIFICTGIRCADQNISAELNQWLKERLKQLGLHEGTNRVQRSQSSCLGVCQGGPLAVVYPDNVWYGGLDKEKLEQIIQEHLIGGQPVHDFMIASQSPV